MRKNQRLFCLILLGILSIRLPAAIAEESITVDGPQSTAISMLTLLLSSEPLVRTETKDASAAQAEMTAYTDALLARYQPWISPEAAEIMQNNNLFITLPMYCARQNCTLHLQSLRLTPQQEHPDSAQYEFLAEVVIKDDSGMQYADATISGILRVVDIEGQWLVASCKLYTKQLEAIAR